MKQLLTIKEGTKYLTGKMCGKKGKSICFKVLKKNYVITYDAEPLEIVKFGKTIGEETEREKDNRYLEVKINYKNNSSDTITYDDEYYNLRWFATMSLWQRIKMVFTVTRQLNLKIQNVFVSKLMNDTLFNKEEIK